MTPHFFSSATKHATHLLLGICLVSCGSDTNDVSVEAESESLTSMAEQCFLDSQCASAFNRQNPSPPDLLTGSDTSKISGLWSYTIDVDDVIGSLFARLDYFSIGTRGETYGYYKNASRNCFIKTGGINYPVQGIIYRKTPEQNVYILEQFAYEGGFDEGPRELVHTIDKFRIVNENTKLTETFVERIEGEPIGGIGNTSVATEITSFLEMDIPVCDQ